jgi:hypothetical protein
MAFVVIIHLCLFSGNNGLTERMIAVVFGFMRLYSTWNTRSWYV